MTQRQRIEVKQTLRLKLSTGLRAAIEMLRQDAAGLTRFLEEQAAQNPALILTPAVPKDWLPRWSGVLPGAARFDLGEVVAGPGPSLAAHVSTHIGRRMKSPADRKIALALADALAPSGRLDRPVLAIARETGHRLAEVEAVLRRLQEIEPAGLFARDLAECLRLQAQEAGIFDRVMKVVLSHLDLLARGDFARIAQLAGTDLAEVQRRFRLIRTMNPKPGTAFDPLMAQSLREPDLVARPRGDGGWDISLNGSALPDVQVSDSAEVPSRAAARNLQRMVAARNDTVLRLGAEVMRRQKAALDHGGARLQPMTMAEIALALDLHESTVSRVVAGLSIDTPWGVWWLRRLFSRNLGTGAGDEALSGAGLRDLMARRIAAEDPAAPLSDAALAQGLGADLGLTLARRTVAKYRGILGIPPAHRRKAR